MNIEIDKCGKCGLSLPIVNKKYKLCEKCNHLRLHGISYQEKIEGRERSKTIQKKKNYVIPCRNIIKSKQRHDRDRDTYLEVFNTRESKCEECSCDLPDIFEDEIVRIMMLEQYSHILSKAAYPEFRNNPKNFNRLCGLDHTKWESGDRKLMRIYERNQIVIQELLEERNKL